MVFLFQTAKMGSRAAIAEKAELPKSDVRIVKRAIAVIDLNKLNAKLPGGESGYYDNNLAAKGKSLKRLMEQPVSELALFCVQQCISDWSAKREMKSVMGDATYSGFAKSVGKANYNIDTNDLSKALVAEFKLYFPKEKELCEKYVEQKVIPYLKNLAP